jgi:hypothetical protein
MQPSHSAGLFSLIRFIPIMLLGFWALFLASFKNPGQVIVGSCSLTRPGRRLPVFPHM